MRETPLSEGALPSPSPGSLPGRPIGTRHERSQAPVLSQTRSPESDASAAREPAGSAPAAAPPATPSEGGDSGAAPRRRRRRGSRGGRRRKKGPSSDSSSSGTKEASEDETSSESKTSKAPRRRGRKASSGKETASSAGGEESAARKKRTRKRGSRGGRRRKKAGSSAVEVEFIPGEVDDLPELTDLPDGSVLLESESQKTTRSKRGRKKKTQGKTTAKTSRKAGATASKKKRSSRKGRRKAAGSEDERPEEASEPQPPRKRLILVNAGDPEETRVAVVEAGRIVELQMSVKKHTSYVNDIYRGRVVNLEPAIGAAFVDFGQGRNGFLHASDVLPSYGESDWSLEKLLSTPVEPDAIEGGTEKGDSEKEEDSGGEEAKPRQKGRAGRGGARGRRTRLPIEKLVKKGQMVAVQITKDAIGDKGPTLTTYVSIPGRYLVLMPSLERTGVSRKIDDDKERRRLKRILSSLDIPEGMGVIVRTAGIGKTKTEIRRDLEYLLLAWEDFSKRLKSGRNPAPLYQESDVAIRTMRDLFTAETEKVVVDDDEVYDRMVEFTNRLMPEHTERIKLHDAPRPLFHVHGVEQDFEKIFSRRVELPSGGSIVIDQTEALVAIDVNSGRTREAGAEFEDIALKTNLEAAPEIARQIRLRDLGGIIVLDYIDMMRANSRRAVERATRDCLKQDRARSKIGRISQFGLLELTRQRLGPGLNKLVYDNCQRCRGSGRQRNPSSRAQAILRRLGAAQALKGFTTVEARAHPEVIEYLEKELSAELERFEEQSGRNLILMSVPDQVEDSVLHYLRADGREVRPGGRRKR